MEADPRHAELIIKEMGCEGAKVTTALVKERVDEVDEAELLEPTEASKYRSVSIRLAYLSQDRPDLQVLAKELAKGLKSPTKAHWMMLKRGARYLRNRPRLIRLFPNQTSLSRIDVWCDADHAGCLRTRKSTSGSAETGKRFWCLFWLMMALLLFCAGARSAMRVEKIPCLPSYCPLAA